MDRGEGYGARDGTLGWDLSTASARATRRIDANPIRKMSLCLPGALPKTYGNSPVVEPIQPT